MHASRHACLTTGSVGTVEPCAAYTERVITVATLLMAGALLALWRGLLWRGRGLPGVDRPQPWLVGHRGVRGAVPENSVAAFRAAYDAGLDGIETDVQRSRDGALVLVHDTHVDGVEVTALTLDELRRRVTDLATLDELFDLARAAPGTWLNLEIKTRGAGLSDIALVRALVRSVRASGLAERVCVSSFDPLALAQLRLLAPELRTGYLWHDHPSVPRWLRTPWPAGWLHVDALHPHWSNVDARLAERARRRGLGLNVWTVNDADEVRRLLALRVSGIMADDPHALRRAARGGPG